MPASLADYDLNPPCRGDPYSGVGRGTNLVKITKRFCYLYITFYLFFICKNCILFVNNKNMFAWSLYFQFHIVIKQSNKFSLWRHQLWNQSTLSNTREFFSFYYIQKAITAFSKAFNFFRYSLFPYGYKTIR